MIKENKLSIIITAHSEGILLHKTILSVLNAVEELKKNNIKYEIILHVDNPDKKTKDYIESHPNKNITIYYNNFKDLGLSRNFAIENATGNIIAVIDGDDLISPNWFLVAYEKIINSEEYIVVHPEHNLTFGINICNQVLWTQADSKDDNTDKLLLAGANLWASCCAARRDVYLKFPYKKAQNGFGNEDWCFNCETRNAGIKHYVGKDTVQFYRRKADSLLSANISNKLVQWPNPLFDLMEYKKIPLPNEVPKTPKNYSCYLKRGFRIVHGALLRTSLKYVLIPSANVVKKIINYKQIEEKNISKRVLKEWADACKIESQLYPTSERIKNVIFYTSNNTNIGKALRLIIEPMTALPDYVFIVPWLKTGGADKVVLNYIVGLSKIHPEWHFAIITTLEDKNEWKNKLPNNAYLLDFANITKNLNLQEREDVFSRLLIELRCERVHIINSQYGYEYVSSHKELFDKNFKLVVSIFNYEYISGTNRQGFFEYADPYLVNIDQEVKKIYSDNQTYLDRCAERCGFDKKKLIVHYQPMDIDKKSVVSLAKKANNSKMRILWASRICGQKYPEILIKIANNLKEEPIEISVYGKMDEGYNETFFKDVPNLKYKGEFDGIGTLNVKDYDLFLYTSRGDGIPNIILEVANFGIPIVASNVGGVGEFIKNKETGYLIDDVDNAKSYINAIRRAKDNPEEAKKYAKNAYELLKKQHSWESFIEKIKRDID